MVQLDPLGSGCEDGLLRRWALIPTPISRNAYRMRWGEDGAPERKIEWPVSLRTKMKFTDLLNELVALELEPQEPETLARMAALRDEIRSLPRFPRKFHPERDVIVPVVTSAQR